MNTAQMSTPPSMAAPARVLAVRLDQLGDVLMSTPALAAIKESIPNVHVSLLTSASGALAARQVSEIDEIITFEAPWVSTPSPGEMVDLLARLRSGRFDAAVIFTVATQSALPAAMACLQAGIAIRLAHSRENPYHLLSHWVRDTDTVMAGMRHEVERQLDLVAAMGWRTENTRLRFTYAAQDEARVHGLLRSAGLDEARPYVVLHPGATAPSRRYPAERFGGVADLLCRDAGVRVVFSGGAQDQVLVRAARSGMRWPSIDLSGQLSLGELGALIKGARTLIANNTGPVHIAAALGTPVVDLYALTNPQHTPWQVAARVLSHDVDCRYCLKSVCPRGDQACLHGVSLDQVARAAMDLIAP